MEIFTPHEVAANAGSKYRGILVAARFARYLNEFPRETVVSWEQAGGRKKLTTMSLEKLTDGELTFRELRRRRSEA